jgi:SAM-dependent methyltransferase
MPGALHLARKGHDVWIECPEAYHPIFEWVSYVRPWSPGCPAPDRVFDTTALDMAKCDTPIIDYVNVAFPKIADAPRGRTVLFDRRPAVPDYSLPERYAIVSPYGYSQFGNPPLEWMLRRLKGLCVGTPQIFCLSDRPRPECPVPVLTARTVAHLPHLIAGAEEILTTNSAPNIIAAAVRRSHLAVWDEDPVGGRTNYAVPHQVMVRYNPAWKQQQQHPFAWLYGAGGPGSGGGSTPAYTEGYRRFLESFIREHGIRSVLDFGCGDWQFSRLVDWGDVLYYGVEGVPALVARLRMEHGAPNRIFYVVDPAGPELPNHVDLLICKDVLQHLPNADVQRLLQVAFPCARHWILVNDKDPDPARNNGDVHTSLYRCLDLRAPPFSLHGTEIFRFPPEWPKVALWVRRDGA